MKRIIFLSLLLVATLASATDFTAKLTTTSGSADTSLYLQIELQGCAKFYGATGNEVVLRPQRIYPDGSGTAHGTIIDQANYTCGTTRGTAYYMIYTCQRGQETLCPSNALRAVAYDITGSTFNLATAIPKAGLPAPSPVNGNASALQGKPISATAPQAGEGLFFNAVSGKYEPLSPAAAAVPDATSSTKGKVALNGDLGGTADAPTVPGLSTLTVALDTKANDNAVIHNTEKTGSGDKVASATSTPADGCATWSNGNVGSTGIACGSSGGGGTGTVNPGSAGQFAKYTADGTAVSGASVTKTDVGLANVDNTADAAKNVATAVTLATGADRTKLDGIAANAEVNVNADWNASSGDAQILNKPVLPQEKVCLSTDKFSGYDPVTGLFTCTADAGGGSGGVWGAIAGTMTDQTDLAAALAGKSPTTHTHTGVYEPANANIQAHIARTDNPHATTASQVGAVPTTRTINGLSLGANINITTITGNAGTATSLAANGSNCQLGQASTGVDALGNAEGCFTPSGSGTVNTGVIGQVAFYTSAGALSGDAGFTYDPATKTATLGALNTIGLGYINLGSQTDSTTTGDFWRSVDSIKYRGTSTTYTLATNVDILGREPANANIQAHIARTDNPHAVTKTQVGLGNVDNTADASKSVASAAAVTGKTFQGTGTVIPQATGTATAGKQLAYDANGNIIASTYNVGAAGGYASITENASDVTSTKKFIAPSFQSNTAGTGVLGGLMGTNPAALADGYFGVWVEAGVLKCKYNAAGTSCTPAAGAVTYGTTAGTAAEGNDARILAAGTHAARTDNPHAVTAAQAGAVPTTRTVNTKPLSGDVALTTADVPDSTDKRYVTEAQKTVLAATSGSNTGDETAAGIRTKLGITTLSGSNTGDQDLSSYATTAALTSGLAGKAASNASTSVNGVACALGSTCTVTAAAGAIGTDKQIAYNDNGTMAGGPTYDKTTKTLAVGGTGAGKTTYGANTGGGSFSIVAPDSTTANAAVQVKLPPADVAGKLASDGAGQLSFIASYGVASFQYITATGAGTYTTPTGVKAILVECQAGGGGGGGVTGAASSVGVGGGGGSGSYGRKFILSPAASYSVSVGIAGTAGANTGGTGGTGGDTVWDSAGTPMTCKGGVGGVGQATGTSAVMVAGGAGGATTTGGDLNAGGTAGGWSYRISGTVGVSGTGAPSEFGGGGAGVTAAAAGSNATGYGGGGGGAMSTNTTARAGGLGTQGIIVVWEFK